MLFSKVKSTHTRRILCRVSGLVLPVPRTDAEVGVFERLPAGRESCLTTDDVGVVNVEVVVTDDAP